LFGDIQFMFLFSTSIIQTEAYQLIITKVNLKLDSLLQAFPIRLNLPLRKKKLKNYNFA